MELKQTITSNSELLMFVAGKLCSIWRDEVVMLVTENASFVDSVWSLPRIVLESIPSDFVIEIPAVPYSSPPHPQTLISPETIEKVSTATIQAREQVGASTKENNLEIGICVDYFFFNFAM